MRVSFPGCLSRVERSLPLPVTAVERSVLEEMPVFPGLFPVEEVFTKEEAAENEKDRLAHAVLIAERTHLKEVELVAELAARRN